MTVAGERHDKRTEAVESLGAWVQAHSSFRPPMNAERDAGVAAHLAGHHVRVVESMAIMDNLDGSPVWFQIDGAPGVLVETTRERALNPSVGFITQLENRITSLPKAVSQQEQRIEEARQEYRDAAATLKEPFKHEEALKKAQWNVERIGRLMSGEEAPQPTFDSEFETMKRLQCTSFPFAPGAGAKSSGTPVAQQQATQPQLARESEGIGY